MECAWISNFVTLETEALLTFCQEKHGVGIERARAGAGLKAGFLRQKNVWTKRCLCQQRHSVLLSELLRGCGWKERTGYRKKPRPIGGKGRKDGAVPEP